MEIINRKLLKWVFIVVIIITAMIKLNGAFAQAPSMGKAGSKGNEKQFVPGIPVPEFTLMNSTPDLRVPSVAKSNSDLQNLIPDSYKSHPEFGKMVLDQSPASVELIQERTADSRTFANPDGSYSKVQYSGPVHYKDAQGRWMSIGEKAQRSSRKLGEYGVYNTDKPISLNLESGNYALVLDNNYGIVISGDPELAILNSDGTISKRIKRDGVTRGIVNEDDIKFNNVWPGIDKSQVICNTGVITDFIINTPLTDLRSDNLLQISEEIKLPLGWTIKKSASGIESSLGWSGGLEILNGTGSKVGEFRPLIYFDSNQNESENSLLNGYYKVSQGSEIAVINVIVPGSWLASAERVFPVTIDPSIVNTYSSGVIGSSLNAYCTANMTVSLPANSTVSDVVCEATYNAQGSTKRNNARISFTGPAGTTTDYYCNDGFNGVCNVNTGSSNIADGFYATGAVAFSINVKRTNGGGGTCTTDRLSINNNTWKETLTYSVCSTPTSGGTISGPTTGTCSQTYNYSCAGGSGSYQWQYSSNGGSTYTDISGATSSTMSISYNATGTYMIRVLRSASSCSNSYSNVISLVISNPTVGVSTTSPIVISSLPYSGLHSSVCYSSTFTGSGAQGTPSVFFKVTTSACANSLTINTCDATSSFDTYIFLLSSTGSVLTSNDDYNGCTYKLNGNNRFSQINAYTVTPNTVYYVVVQSYFSASPNNGNFGLNITEGSNSLTPSVSVAANPSGAICTNTSVTFTATPVNGGTTPTYAWTVNGITAGTNSSTFTSSTLSNNDVVRVSMTSNLSCAVAGAVQSSPVTMTVNPIPTFTAGATSSLCQGGTINLTITNPPTGASFLWTGPSSYSSTTQNPSIPSASVAMGGTYSARVTSSAGCSATATASVTVNPTNTVSVSTSSSPSGGICPGTAVTFTATPVNGGSTPVYAWTVNGNSVGTNSTSFSSSTLANNDVVRVSLTSNISCPSATTVQSSPLTMVVNPLPTFTAGGTSSLCQGGTINLTISGAPAGSTYLWTGPASYSSSTQNPSITNATTAMGGTYSARVTSSAGCSSTSNVSVAVNSTNAVSVSVTANPSGAICPNTSVTFTAVPVNGGASPVYAWTVNGSSVGTNSSTFTSSTLSNGAVVRASVTSNASCPTPATAQSSPLTITVNSAPAISVNAPTAKCVGGTINLSVTGAPVGANYAWSGPASFTSTSASPSVSNVTLSSSGSYSVVVTAPGYCSSSASATTTVSSGMNLSIASFTDPACSGPANGAITLSLSGAIGTPGYLWSNGATTSSLSSLSGGTYQVTVTDAAGCTATISKTLATPSAVTASNAGLNRNLCNLSSVQLSANTPVVGVGRWSKISGSGALSSLTDPNATVSGLSSVDPNVFRWTIKNSCDSSYSDVVIRNFVSPPPNHTTVLGPSWGCTGDTLSFNTILDATDYVWTARPSGQIVSGQGTNAVRIVFGTTTTTGFDACVVGTNACGSSIVRCLGVRNNTSVPRLITTSTDICDGETKQFAINQVTGASNYKWTGPAGVTVNGQPVPYTSPDTLVNIFFPAGYGTATIGVASTAGCQYSPPRELIVSSTPAIPGVITGNKSELCNSDQVYSIIPKAGMQYEWSVPTGAIVRYTSQIGDTLIVGFTSNIAGNISVKAKNICGKYSPLRTLSISTSPITPGAITGPVVICPNTGGNIYSIVSVPGALGYQWTLPTGATLESGGNTNSISVRFGSTAGRVSVQTIGNCGLSVARTVMVSNTCRTTDEPTVDANGQKISLQAYPDADTKNVTVTFNGVSGKTYKYTVIDIAGQDVLHGEVNAEEGKNMLDIDMSGLSDAVYKLKVENGTDSSQVTIRFY